jgi:hypothetical protein
MRRSGTGQKAVGPWPWFPLGIKPVSLSKTTYQLGPILACYVVQRLPRQEPSIDLGRHLRETADPHFTELAAIRPFLN